MNQVRFETLGSLGVVTLTNPPLNLFTGELIEDLRAAVTTVKQSSLRALLVRAEGKTFSGGADVSVFKGRTAGEARERFHAPRSCSHSFIFRRASALRKNQFGAVSALLTPVRRPAVNLREGHAHEGGALCLRELVRDPECLNPLRVGQQAHSPGPVGAPQAAIEAERLEDLAQWLPNVWVRKGLMGQGTGTGNLDGHVVAGCKRHHGG